MVLISASKIAKSFGARTLFRDLTFSISEGDKIGLIGPNGAGKSTLLQILVGLQSADEGDLSRANSLRMGYLAQVPQFNEEETVFESIINATDDPYDPETLGLAHELISKLELENAEAGSERKIRELSGGWKKRVALARELVKRPNLLLLDEPTNHLDLPSIVWIENFIARQTELAVLTVTHDRLFLQRTCDLIFDLDRRNPDGLIKFDGTYAEFCDFKEALLIAQKNLELSRKNLLRRETEWLRRGAKARQTKQKARIERAGDLKEEVQNLKAQNLERRLDMEFAEIGRSPKKMVEAQNISKTIGDRVLFKDFSYILTPKSRVGIIGRNGCGKSTMIRHLIGEETPQTGSIRVADGIQFSYFEQQRETLDPNLSLLRTIAPDGDFVHVQGQPIFALSYLARFHFRTDQMDLPVGKLSGGEQSRLMIAKLMTQTESVLVLDEPTNDLDIATLDVLQEALTQFPGAVILVTHDRFFMDQVANEILAFTEDDGEILKFADFFQWEEWAKAKPAADKAKKQAAAAEKKSGAKVKLGYMEQRELDSMEKNIQEAEEKLTSINKELVEVSNQSNFGKLQELTAQMQTQQSQIDHLYKRWQVLQDKLNGS